MMYSDYEVYCWYLGKPFPEDDGRDEEALKPGNLNDIWNEDELDRLFLGLPLLAA